jgi:hypothetical protein
MPTNLRPLLRQTSSNCRKFAEVVASPLVRGRIIVTMAVVQIPAESVLLAVSRSASLKILHGSLNVDQ